MPKKNKQKKQNKELRYDNYTIHQSFPNYKEMTFEILGGYSFFVGRIFYNLQAKYNLTLQEIGEISGITRQGVRKNILQFLQKSSRKENNEPSKN